MGLPEGQGIMTWVSGDVWRGEFKKGLIHGQGKFESQKGRFHFEYTGEFSEGNFDGQGTCR
jgi:hypothetical protein